MTRNRKHLLAACAAALVALLAFGYAIWWQRLAEGLKTGLDAWVVQRNAAGWKVSTGAVAVSGFPFAIHLSLAAPMVADPAGNAWAGPPLDVAVSPLAPERPVASAPGKHALTLAGQPPLPVTAQAATATLLLDRAGPHDVTMALAGVATPAFTADSATIAYHRLAEAPVPHTEPSIAVTASASRVTLAEDIGTGLDRTISDAHVEARLMGTLPGGAPPQALAAWRDDGGTLEIETLRLAWPPLALNGSATLALDPAMQPMMAGSFTIRGLPEMIDRLAGAGAIKPSAAGIAKIALGLLSRPGPDGVPETRAAVTVQNRVLSVGPIKLMALPEVKW